MVDLTTGETLTALGKTIADFEKDLERFPNPSATASLDNFLCRVVAETEKKEAELMKKQGFVDEFGGAM